MAKKEAEAKPPEQPAAPAPVVTSLGNAGVFRVDHGESPTPAPIKTATDNE